MKMAKNGIYEYVFSGCLRRTWWYVEGGRQRRTATLVIRRGISVGFLLIFIFIIGLLRHCHRFCFIV